MVRSLQERFLIQTISYSLYELYRVLKSDNHLNWCGQILASQKTNPSHDPNAGSADNGMNSYLEDREVLKKMVGIPGVQNSINDMAITGSF